LADSRAQGFLDKPGFFVALKLISLAQAGERIDTKGLLLDTNAPRCGDVPKLKQPPPVPKMTHVPPQAIASNTDWTVKPDERLKYQQLFTSLQPENGILPGNKVKGVLMNSKLPLDTLSAIWELADQDKDGSLDEHEFIVAMHLVYKALDSRAIPSSLPKELQKPQAKQQTTNDSFGGDFVANFPTDIVPVAAPVIPAIPSRPPVPVVAAAAVPLIPLAPSGHPNEWVLSTIEKLKYQEVFERSDLDKDGLVSGVEIKDIFLKSGLQQNMLAHIWALCDTHQIGKLNTEQFALAMWLIDRKKKGIDPPQVLAPEMIPPSMRPNAAPPQVSFQY
jgi:epidermal growth factor receptor substrate 15